MRHRHTLHFPTFVAPRMRGGLDAVLSQIGNRGEKVGRDPDGYCQLKSNGADFLPRASNLNAEQSMSYEFVYRLISGQNHLT